jgi:serine/threonine-protein kinase
LKRRRALPPADAAEWFRQLLDGLAAAHAQGVVHRDLKPENVVGASDSDGRLTVKILDFGLAKLGTADPGAGSVTAEGAVMGTLGYMSPEQLLGHEVDHRSDLFAVGVMLVEAITGERPFRGNDYTSLSRAVLHDTYHLPEWSAGARALDACLQRCLAKDPQHRVAAAAELRDDIVPLLRACPAFVGV